MHSAFLLVVVFLPNNVLRRSSLAQALASASEMSFSSKMSARLFKSLPPSLPVDDDFLGG